MTFTRHSYPGLICEASETQARYFAQYAGNRTDFDVIVIGSGMGGGMFADDYIDQKGQHKRLLVIEAGSYLYPTHVFNINRFPNADVAARFKVKNFFQVGDSNAKFYIHEEPMLNLGGRSIFWSGLIPQIQPWELEFFPDGVKQALADSLLEKAGNKMHASITMGKTAQTLVAALRTSPLGDEFDIQETPRALHQPYLNNDGSLRDEFFVEPTGVFNTAELLINQLGLPSHDKNHEGNGLHLLLNHFVEDIQHNGAGYTLVVRNTLTDQFRFFHSPQVVLAAGSIESPKLLKRSSLVHSLPDSVKPLIGRGLTDHPTTDWIAAEVSHLGNIPIPRNTHAKIVFYSRGKRDANNQIKFPFNIEMNINHEYWHLRDNDPDANSFVPNPSGNSILEIKFSFANCLDDSNEIKPAPPFGYMSEVVFHNLNWMDHLAHSRLPALAGWHKSFAEVFDSLNQISQQLLAQFRNNGAVVSPSPANIYGQNNKGFGRGTVHHAVGTLRMPYRPSYQAAINNNSVVDENLQVRGAQGLYVCDMSVMPLSAAANPVRTLAALAMRLSQHVA